MFKVVHLLGIISYIPLVDRFLLRFLFSLISQSFITLVIESYWNRSLGRFFRKKDQQQRYSRYRSVIRLSSKPTLRITPQPPPHTLYSRLLHKMRSSVLLASALGVTTITAAPTWPALNLNAAMPGSLQSVSAYFNMLAQKVQESRSMAEAPVCDLSKASMPVAPVALPPPSAGLTLKHVAVGRGTQNYTCDVANATAIPVAIGAVATLFNASCVISTYPDLANIITKMALQFNLTDDESKLGPSNLAISGKHFFTNTTTPFFNLDRPNLTLGEAACAKLNSTSAPTDAAKGPDGASAVPWLKLQTRVGATGDLEEIYRVQTAGGSAPATCNGMAASFEVQYSAQYWFWEGTQSS
ncbi:hypothetical protein BJ170DRAFT_639192 [Xylariales sp. AK1849]|nr:hypothetical protein BJ170DRAFT_639192 [Xylariales sp. AK1849]